MKTILKFFSENLPSTFSAIVFLFLLFCVLKAGSLDKMTESYTKPGPVIAKAVAVINNKVISYGIYETSKGEKFSKKLTPVTEYEFVPGKYYAVYISQQDILLDPVKEDLIQERTRWEICAIVGLPLFILFLFVKYGFHRP